MAKEMGGSRFGGCCVVVGVYAAVFIVSVCAFRGINRKAAELRSVSRAAYKCYRNVKRPSEVGPLRDLYPIKT